jgi:glycosyltransferase involved in cell wall biosynthesis
METQEDSLPATPARILHVISGLGVGGAETALLRLLERLDRSRFRCTVVSMTSVGVIGEQIGRLGLPVHALGMRRGSPDPRYLAPLVRLVRRERPQIVHTWMYHADLLGGLAARLGGCRRVVWGIRHTNLRFGSDRPTTILVARLNALLSRSVPAKIVCNSEASRRVHTRMGYAASKLMVIPNGFDLEAFRPDPVAREQVRQELGIPPEAPLAGSIARFHPQKDHRTLVKALARINSAMPEVRALLAGEGVTLENAQLAGWIRSAGLEGSVYLLGRRSDTPRLLAALDVFCLSSSHGESFPQVVGEAMACGVPCVVTDVGDAAEIVGEAGLVVAPGRPEALEHGVEVILRLRPEERRRMAERARKRVGERYGIASVVTRYQDLYVGLLGE